MSLITERIATLKHLRTLARKGEQSILIYSPMITNKYNLELDILRADWMRKKVQRSKAYAKNLYASLCNTTMWFKKSESWFCTMEESALIVSILRNDAGSYDEFYGCKTPHLVSSVAHDLSHFGWYAMNTHTLGYNLPNDPRITAYEKMKGRLLHEYYERYCSDLENPCATFPLRLTLHGEKAVFVPPPEMVQLSEMLLKIIDE